MKQLAVVATLAFDTLLFGPSAWAFDCSNVTLQSSAVICSDPDLIRVADERQEAMNEARARLPEVQYRQLIADQNAWIRAYSSRCGVPSDAGSPELPASTSVRACFKREGEARTAYIRAYGKPAAPASAPIPQPVAASDRLGPGFDCSKAKAPLSQLICADPELSRVDLAFNQAFWALYEDVEEADRRRLKEEDNAFLESVLDQCGLPREGALTAETWRARDCVERAYEGKRAEWIRDLSGPALEEARRPLAAHIALERKLRELGFLSGPAAPEGVYAAGTRKAIVAWQEARGRETTGLLSNEDALALQREGGFVEQPPQPGGPLPAPSGNSDEVPLKYEGGTYAVPVVINGVIPLDFLVDSGASDVVLPIDVVLTLMRTGTLTEGDFIGKRKYQLGDGTVVDSDRFYLRNLKVGNHVLEHVTAAIQKVESGPLLGQSFLSKFDFWALDNRRHVLVLGAGNELPLIRNGSGQLAPLTPGKP